MAAEADQEAGCLSAALGRKKNACFRLSPDGAGLPVRNVRKRKRDAAERGQCPMSNGSVVRALVSEDKTYKSEGGRGEDQSSFLHALHRRGRNGCIELAHIE
jgi:hypothetical protein